jgi:serine protease inhibitor
MKLRIISLILILVAAGCARDEFGSRDSGGSISVLGDPQASNDDEDTAVPNDVNNAPGGNNLGSPEPFPTTDQGDEGVSPAALLAMEAITRATFTDASASSGNFVFSPLALASTLTVAGLAGDAAMREAVEARLAQSDLESVALGLSEVISATHGGEDEPVNLSTMWVDPSTSIDAGFLEAVVPELVQDVRTVDFSSIDQARQTINNYYRTQSDGLLPSVVGPLGLKTGERSALVNAVYFHGAWDVPFSVDDTAEGVFRGDGGDVTTAFMEREGSFLVRRATDYDAIVVPYRSTYSLVLIKASDVAARTRIEGQFSAQLLTEIIDQSQVEQVRLKMPRLEVEGRLESNLFGVAVADNAEREGSFGNAGIESSGALIQRAVVSFDESGTSAIFPNDSAGALFSSEFALDQPYLFAIRESSTGFVLLAGRVNRL